MKRDGSDGHDENDKPAAGWPDGPRGADRKARIGGGGGGNISSSGIDKRRVLTSMEQLWRVYEVVMKRDIQLKGSVGIFNKVRIYSDMYVDAALLVVDDRRMTPSLPKDEFFRSHSLFFFSFIHIFGTTLSAKTITYLRLLR